eukprot:IDg9050t1
MGNSCCGGEDDIHATSPGRTVSGAPPSTMTMKPADAEVREKMLQAAEERQNKSATRGTKRKTPIKPAAYNSERPTGTTGTTDLSVSCAFSPPPSASLRPLT